MARSGPGRSDRIGMSVVELLDLFPSEDAARAWFETIRWPDGERHCPHCGSMQTALVPKAKPMPYRCPVCRQYFSVKTGTAMQSSNLPLRKWVIAMYLMSTNLKGVSSMKLHRDLGITQKSAWYMAHRIRETWREDRDQFAGPVEVDETYIGGKEKNKHADKKLHAGRGTVGKTAVAGAKDRATNEISAAVVTGTSKRELHGFARDRIAQEADVFTDDLKSYEGLPQHTAVRHSVGEYVRQQAHTKGMESFWSMLKRGYYGTYHRMSPKHLQRYVNEFAGRHNQRCADTIVQMTMMAQGMIGRRLRYEDLKKN